jgi:hypothetical protein
VLLANPVPAVFFCDPSAFMPIGIVKSLQSAIVVMPACAAWAGGVFEHSPVLAGTTLIVSVRLIMSPNATAPRQENSTTAIAMGNFILLYVGQFHHWEGNKSGDVNVQIAARL